MGCIINWDAKNTPNLDALNLAADGCIVQWRPQGEMESMSKLGGCFINWDSADDVRAAARTAQGGCIIDWDEGTDIASLSANRGEALGCIVNWMGIDAGTLKEAAEGGCIINW